MIISWLKGRISGTGGYHLEDMGARRADSPEAVEACLEESKSSPILVFKHSTACPISAGAYQQVGQYAEEHQGSAPPLYLVYVIESRPASNAVAEKTDVKHASPQILLLKDGKAVWNASHGGITKKAIEKAVEQAA